MMRRLIAMLVALTCVLAAGCSAKPSTDPTPSGTTSGSSPASSAAPSGSSAATPSVVQVPDLAGMQCVAATWTLGPELSGRNCWGKDGDRLTHLSTATDGDGTVQRMELLTTGTWTEDSSLATVKTVLDAVAPQDEALVVSKVREVLDDDGRGGGNNGVKGALLTYFVWGSSSGIFVSASTSAQQPPPMLMRTQLSTLDPQVLIKSDQLSCTLRDERHLCSAAGISVTVMTCPDGDQPRLCALELAVEPTVDPALFAAVKTLVGSAMHGPVTAALDAWKPSVPEGEQTLVRAGDVFIVTNGQPGQVQVLLG